MRASHESFDGTGYPDGLAGQAIPIEARICSTCDAFSAMTTDRAYRAAMSEDDALAELRRCAGTQFDPRVVAAFETLLPTPRSPEPVRIERRSPAAVRGGGLTDGPAALRAGFRARFGTEPQPSAADPFEVPA